MYTLDKFRQNLSEEDFRTLLVTCPRPSCFAVEGLPCFDRSGHILWSRVHQARKDSYNAVLY